MDEDSTPTDFVNIERGSKSSNISHMIYKQDQIMEEIRQFRKEMKVFMGEHVNEYKTLYNRFINTELELKQLRKQVEILQEKVDKVQVLKTKQGNIVHKNEILEDSTVTVGLSIDKNTETKYETENIRTFATATKQNQNRVVKNKIPIEECMATKQSDKERIIKSSDIKKTNQSGKLTETEKLTSQKEGNWITVNKKKNRYPNIEVKKGGSTNSVDIKGTERKKFLHVWRLCKETTVENLEKYVKTICGSLVPVTVEVIKHRTERDYASFIIGVPESSYDTLCKPENWAVNIEFCEWVWFRRSTKKPQNN